jgi:hypothetical protein
MKRFYQAVFMVVPIVFILFAINLSWSEQKIQKTPYMKDKKDIPSIQKEQPVIRDGGSWETVDPGIDLVVSKVEIRRGTFGTDPSTRIQIIPYVKNMWNGRTSERIKVLFDGLGYAVWIEGGIGANEEKSGGAIYLSDSSGSRSLRFSVEVDNNNLIPENNDHNNRCENVTLSSSETRKTHTCTIVGPHEPMI